MQGEAGIPGMPGPKGVTVSYYQRDATSPSSSRDCVFFFFTNHFKSLFTFFRALQEMMVKGELLEQGSVPRIARRTP